MKINKPPKYSILEIEKKWLIDKQKLPDLKKLEFCIIEDSYINNSRIRLRKVKFPSNNETKYKLTKKYGKINDFSEPITTIYLNENEFKIFNNLKASRLKKTRYYFPYLDNIFAIDEIKNNDEMIYLLEIEVKAAVDFKQINVPNFILEKVSLNEEFSGNTLSFNQVQ